MSQCLDDTQVWHGWPGFLNIRSKPHPSPFVELSGSVNPPKAGIRSVGNEYPSVLLTTKASIWPKGKTLRKMRFYL